MQKVKGSGRRAQGAGLRAQGAGLRDLVPLPGGARGGLGKTKDQRHGIWNKVGSWQDQRRA
jgi:hypothetical protein